MKSLQAALEKRLSIVVLVLLAIQPMLDVFSYFLEQLGSNALSTLVRFFLLAAVALVGFLVSGRKKLYFIFYGIAGLFWLAHMFNCLRIGYTSLVADAGNFLRIVNFPIFALSLITFFQKKDLRGAVYLGFAIDLCEVLLFTLLPWVLGHPVYTYEALEVGMLGWFSTPSAQSAIVVLLLPLTLLWVYRAQKYPLFLLAALAGFGLLFVTGTKFTFYSIFIVAGAWCFVLAIQPHWKWSNLKYVLPLLAIMVVAFGFRHHSPMALRERMTAYSQGEYGRLVEENLEKSGVDKDMIRNILEDEENDAFTLPPEIRLERLRQNLLGVYSDRDVYGPFFKNLNQRFGVYRVMDAYDYTIDTSVLSDSRVRKTTFAKLVWEEKDLLTRLLGFEYSDMLYGGAMYDLENDFPAVFYFCGYLGFGLYLLFFAYFAFLLLRALVWYCQAALAQSREQRQAAAPGKAPAESRFGKLKALWQGFRRYLTLELGAVGMTFLLAIIAAQISGNVLRRPNVTVYFAAAAACVYALTRRSSIESGEEKF